MAAQKEARKTTYIMQNITPQIPIGRKVIEKYGDGTFTITHERYESSVIILPDEVYPISVNDISEATAEHFKVIMDNADNIEVLLVGTGNEIKQINESVRIQLSEQRMSVDIMDTGSACRTYNVLLSEERRVAAFLISV